MKHRILSWNVRWLNEGNKRMWARHLLSQWKVDIVFLQETKLELITTGLVQSVEMSVCGVVSCGFCCGFKWDIANVG
jgi:exonuclease III